MIVTLELFFVRYGDSFGLIKKNNPKESPYLTKNVKSWRTNTYLRLDIRIRNVPIKHVRETKFLGLKIDDRLYYNGYVTVPTCKTTIAN